MHISQSKSRTVADIANRLRAAEIALRNDAASRGYVITDTALQRHHAARIEDLSEGRNTVLYSDAGVPGVYVRIDNDANQIDHLRSELGLSGNTDHEAFQGPNGRLTHFHYAKYLATMVNPTTGAIVNDLNGAPSALHCLSLPGFDPSNNCNWTEAWNYATNDGSDGYHLATMAEWAWIYLLTLAWQFEPRGNTDFGRDYQRTDERGVLQANPIDRTLTGSGPVAWNHDGTPYGISDICGNIWEWLYGYRSVNGEIQILPGNDYILDHGASSSDWRAIDADTGALVDPGEPGTLKWDMSPFRLSDEITTSGAVDSEQFSGLQTAAGVDAPQILKRLGIFPLDSIRPDRGAFWVNNQGERIPSRGGSRANGAPAGVASLVGNNTRTSRFTNFGFRPAFAL